MSEATFIPDDFSVRLDFFSGPMDLLLHLVEQREVPIEKVDLCELCNQYLQIIYKAVELDLERAGEYLVVAATLAARKSEALLPVSSNMEDSEELGTFDTRFFSELRERLKAYKQTKERSALLLSRPQLGVHEFTCKRVAEAPEEENDFEEVKGDGHTIARYFYRLLKRIGEASKEFKVRLEPIVVVKFMVSVVDSLAKLVRKPTNFLSLVSSLNVVGNLNVAGGLDQKETMSPKAKLTGVFIAALELVKRGVVVANVKENDFTLELRDASQQPSLQFSSEFDMQPGISDNVIEMARYRKSEQVDEHERLENEKRSNEKRSVA